MNNDLTMEVMDRYYDGESLPSWAREVAARFLIKQRRMLREFNANCSDSLEVLPF
jgi:hypothetical protein